MPMHSVFDTQHLWHPYSAPDIKRPNPIVERAEGVYITLADGTKMIDAMSSWWCTIHGYNHPIINQAVTEQLQSMSHVMFGGLTHQPAIDLGKTLLSIAPSNMQRIFYADSGSVSVEIALKMAVQHHHSQNNPQKTQFIALQSAYHGDTWKAMSVSDPTTGMHHIFSDALQKEHFTQRPPITFTEPWQNDNTKNGLNQLEYILSHHGERIAAMIIEPIVQGAGGMHFYHPDYINQCRTLCDAHNVLLIFDEIATGFGRTGKLFATEHTNVLPDILCLGKAITGGYMSFAATLCSAQVAQTIGQGEPGVFMHGPTFMANPLACSAANANLQILLNSSWQKNIQQIEQQLRTELAQANNIPYVKSTRALGAIGVIEMEKPIDVTKAQQLSLQLGVWLRPFGKLIYCMPPYIIKTQELQKITKAMQHLAKHCLIA